MRGIIVSTIAFGLVASSPAPEPKPEPSYRHQSYYGGGSSVSCAWEGHCLHDRCYSYNDCDGDLICTHGRCSEPPNYGGDDYSDDDGYDYDQDDSDEEDYGNGTCEWEGHCLNDKCYSYNDCDGDLICTGGKCSNPPSYGNGYSHHHNSYNPNPYPSYGNHHQHQTHNYGRHHSHQSYNQNKHHNYHGNKHHGGNNHHGTKGKQPSKGWPSYAPKWATKYEWTSDGKGKLTEVFTGPGEKPEYPGRRETIVTHPDGREERTAVALRDEE